MKPDLLAYRPPRIAMLLAALAALVSWSLHLERLGPPVLSFVAPAVGLAGFGLMMLAWWQFRRRGVAICPTAATVSLITDGIYRFTRNPMYLGMVLMLLALAMFAGTVPFYVAALALFGVLNFAFCPYEERKLANIFGPAFRAYRERVPRWL
jgi:protein-S-isoprenylcysteine O-methyltransferase Ste14